MHNKRRGFPLFKDVENSSFRHLRSPFGSSRPFFHVMPRFFLKYLHLIFANWFTVSVLVGIVLSVPLFGRDLDIMLAWEQAARDKAGLQWWANVSSRSIFSVGSLGAHDVSRLIALLVFAGYVLSFRGALARRFPSLHSGSGYYLICLLCFFAVNCGMKAFFGRVRPSDVLRGDLDYTSMWSLGHYEFADALSQGSFTSGHTTMAMVLLPLAFVALGSSRRAALPVLLFVMALAWGLFVGWGRVLNGLHYPSDILWAVIVCIWVCVYVRDHVHVPYSSTASQALPLRDLRLAAWLALGLFLTFLAMTGVKEIVFRFSLWWPGATILSALGAWFCLHRVGAVQRWRVAGGCP